MAGAAPFSPGAHLCGSLDFGEEGARRAWTATAELGARKGKNWLLPLPPPRNRLSLVNLPSLRVWGVPSQTQPPGPGLGHSWVPAHHLWAGWAPWTQWGWGRRDPPHHLESLDGSHPLGTWWGEDSQSLGPPEGHTPHGGPDFHPLGLSALTDAGSVSSPLPSTNPVWPEHTPSREEPE